MITQGLSRPDIPQQAAGGHGLALLPAGMIAWMLALALVSIGRYLQAFGAGYLTGRPGLLPLPSLILGSLDTWSVSLMAVLTWAPWTPGP